MGDKLKLLHKFWRDKSGISSVEYALLLAFIAAGIVVAADQLGEAVETEINDAAECVELAADDPNNPCVEEPAEG